MRRRWDGPPVPRPCSTIRLIPPMVKSVLFYMPERCSAPLSSNACSLRSSSGSPSPATRCERASWPPSTQRIRSCEPCGGSRISLLAPIGGRGGQTLQSLSKGIEGVDPFGRTGSRRAANCASKERDTFSSIASFMGCQQGSVRRRRWQGRIKHGERLPRRRKRDAPQVPASNLHMINCELYMMNAWTLRSNACGVAPPM